MRIQWVGSPSLKLKVIVFISVAFVTILYGYVLFALVYFVESRKERDQVIAKQEQIISELEYKLLNCRMNTINEILKGGEIKVDGSKLDLPPPPKPMEIRKSN